MKSIVTAAFATISVLGLVACTAEGQHEAKCVGGVLGGAALGGLVGNQVGAGQGNALATAAGAAAGAVIASNQMPQC